MLNNTTWIFFHGNPISVASYRLSGILPADFLKIKKAIFLQNDNPIKFLNLLDSNILIFSRPFHHSSVELAREAKSRGIKIILTCDDWNFIYDTEHQKISNNILNDISIISDKVVVKTQVAADVVKKNTKIIPNVISDCLSFKTHKPISKIQYPFEIAWFGKHVNLDTLYYGMKETLDKDLIINLKIVTNITKNFESFKKEIDKLNLKNISINIEPWSFNFENQIKNKDIVIVPYIYDKKRIVKSINRLTDSMNLGKLVITSKMPFNLNLEKYCVLGNIGEGLKWVKANQKKAIQKAINGNKFASKNFNLEKISKDWLNLINKLK